MNSDPERWDSTKALVMVGLTNVVKDYYGAFPLSSKLMNMQDSSPAQKGLQRALHHLIYVKIMKVNEGQIINITFSKQELCQYRPGTYIDQSVDSISYTEFINEELVQSYMANNIRSIPSMVNGL
ncbi:DNA topoisomerase 2 [Massospora cicadina]|nr:DNA topoisomerase 2 [Massospora cicadina]